MNSLKRTARLAGLLYLIWVITGIYGVFYIPSQTIVPGDAAATARKILANEFLFRTGIINDIISATLWVFIALVLYRLFKQVNECQAKLLVVLVIVQIPAAFFMEALNIASLMIIKGEVLKTFGISQRQDMAMLFFKISDYGSIVLETFWGLWLLPFGLLVYKSVFIPRILGIFLILNGIAYIIHSFTTLLLPDYQATVRLFAFPFWILGEISIMLWLLIKGVNLSRWKEKTLTDQV
ncbi:MAG: DUF4386 domain-containing protein [Ignavibacteriaceae bacterium]